MPKGRFLNRSRADCFSTILSGAKTQENRRKTREKNRKQDIKQPGFGSPLGCLELELLGFSIFYPVAPFLIHPRAEARPYGPTPIFEGCSFMTCGTWSPFSSLLNQRSRFF